MSCGQGRGRRPACGGPPHRFPRRGMLPGAPSSAPSPPSPCRRRRRLLGRGGFAVRGLSPTDRTTLARGMLGAPGRDRCGDQIRKPPQGRDFLGFGPPQPTPPSYFRPHANSLGRERMGPWPSVLGGFSPFASAVCPFSRLALLRHRPGQRTRVSRGCCNRPPPAW